MRWNYEVKLGNAIIVEGFTTSELEARNIVIAWTVGTILERWPDTIPVGRVWQ